MSRKLTFKQSEVNHLRLMLAWLRCEYMLDEDMQKGYSDAARELVDAGITSQKDAENMLARKADEIRRVPKYVRQAVRMLSKMIKEHDAIVGEIVDGEVISNRLPNGNLIEDKS